MNKAVKGILILLGLAGILFLVGRITGTFRIYKASTISSEPSLKTGRNFFASNIVEPKRFDLICYNIERPEGMQTWVHRLCGMPGDKVQIKGGILYVNNTNADSNLNLAHNYFIPAKDLSLLDKFMLVKEEFIIGNSGDSVNLYIADKIVKENNIQCRRYIIAPSSINGEIETQYGKNWNQDNFGPIIVPSDNYFLLGDNRHNSLDSRYVGYIPVYNYVATVIWHK